MTGKASTAGTGRVLERRRAVALARHYREFEGLSIRQIADRLGRSPATVKAYFYDPTGEKARAVKARYVGVCRGCGAYTQPRNGKGDAYAYCKALPSRRDRAALDPGPGDLGDAANGARATAGFRPPTTGRATQARRRGGEALERLAGGEWPAASVVSSLFGTWATARAAASGEDVDAPRTGGLEPVEPIGHTGDLYAQSTAIARKIRRSEEVRRRA